MDRVLYKVTPINPLATHHAKVLCFAVLCCVLPVLCQSCYAMLCYAMLCYAMLCYAMLCYAMLCYAMLCYVMLCCAVLCCAVLCCAMLCYAMLCYATLWCVSLCYAVLFHAMPCDTVLPLLCSLTVSIVVGNIKTLQGWSNTSRAFLPFAATLSQVPLGLSSSQPCQCSAEQCR